MDLSCHLHRSKSLFCKNTHFFLFSNFTVTLLDLPENFGTKSKFNGFHRPKRKMTVQFHDQQFSIICTSLVLRMWAPDFTLHLGFMRSPTADTASTMEEQRGMYTTLTAYMQYTSGLQHRFQKEKKWGARETKTKNKDKNENKKKTSQKFHFIISYKCQKNVHYALKQRDSWLDPVDVQDTWKKPRSCPHCLNWGPGSSREGTAANRTNSEKAPWGMAEQWREAEIGFLLHCRLRKHRTNPRI